MSATDTFQIGPVRRLPNQPSPMKILFSFLFSFFLQGRLPRCSMSSAPPSLTVPVILRNLCLSENKGSSLGSVVATFSRPCMSTYPGTFYPQSNPIYAFISSVPFLCFSPCPTLCPASRPFGASSLIGHYLARTAMIGRARTAHLYRRVPCQTAS